MEVHHIEELQRSGLNPDTIVRSTYSATAKQVKALIGKAFGPGLAFPYPGTNGDGPQYTRIKLDTAPTQDGKRYRAPAGQPNHLYIPSTFSPDWLQDIRVALWVTEGEKKCLKAVQEGLACVAVPGVWSWKTKVPTGLSHPIEDLERVAWENRPVFVVFDADIVTKPEVQRAQLALAQDLTRRGAMVQSVRLPGPEKGLDDYLLAHGKERFLALTPTAILDPSQDPGDHQSDRLGSGHRVTWPLHGVVITLNNLHESGEGVHAEVKIVRHGQEADAHWSKLNLASIRSRTEVVNKLKEIHGVPWGALLERSCRLAVEALRAGHARVRVVPRRQIGPRHVLSPIAPAGVASILFGPAGSGKGYFALAMALAISSGATLPGPLKAQVQGPVLYLDWEFSEEDLAERAQQVSEGLGCTVREDLLQYKRMTGPLISQLPAVQADVHDMGAVAVFVDSLVMASGHEPEGAGASRGVFDALRTLAPAAQIVIAHVSKASAASTDRGTPFGSVFNENLPRSVWEVRASEEGPELVQSFFHRKVNSGAKHPPMGFRFRFAPHYGPVTMVAAAVDENPDLAARLSLKDQMRYALQRNSPLAVEALVTVTGASEGSVRTTLNRHNTFVALKDTKPQLWALRITPNG